MTDKAGLLVALIGIIILGFSTNLWAALGLYLALWGNNVWSCGE